MKIDYMQIDSVKTMVEKFDNSLKTLKDAEQEDPKSKNYTRFTQRSQIKKLMEFVRAIKEQRVIFSAHTTYKTSNKKVYRNDKCPCGSGKKYKVCCLPQADPFRD